MTRFDRLVNQAKQGRRSPQPEPDAALPEIEEIPEVKHSDVQTYKQPSAQMSKTKDPSYQRTTVYLPKALHKKLKAAAVDEEKEMSDIIESLVDEWLKNRDA